MTVLDALDDLVDRLVHLQDAVLEVKDRLSDELQDSSVNLSESRHTTLQLQAHLRRLERRVAQLLSAESLPSEASNWSDAELQSFRWSQGILRNRWRVSEDED